MAAIRALLNPMSERRTPRTLTTDSVPAIMSSPNSPRKKAKLTKDAPVFQHGPIRGECRFPPDEYQDQELAAYHQQFEVSPFGEIADYPRHIPYNSEKKTFLEKTNREYLEVFQYTFKKPGDDTQYTMLWDYNIGLVRTTPLFKCTGHSKTTPAKMLNKNPGLKDICHSITGGALVAQGYWIPHRAAKAIAATFCYEIRHALTPVFGHDFPLICIKPGNEKYGDMTIDPEITAYCTEQAKRFREEEPTAVPQGPTPVVDTPEQTPTPRHVRCVRKKPKKQLEDSPYTSPYESDNFSDDNFTLAPSTPPIFRDPWVSVKGLKTPPRSAPRIDLRLPSPRTIMSRCESRPAPILNVPFTPSPTIPSRQPTTELSPTTLLYQYPKDATDHEVHHKLDHQGEGQGRLDCAIEVVSSEIGVSREEIRRRLGIANVEHGFDQSLEAAITMESLKTGLDWEVVASRLDLNNEGHRRSASW